MHRARLIALLPVLLLVAYGCGGNKAAPAGVSGKVTYQGKPVTGGQISFIPDGSGSPYTSQIKSDGTYQVTDVPSGECTVTIEALPDPNKAKGPAYGQGQMEDAAKAAEKAKSEHKDKSGMQMPAAGGSPVPGAAGSGPQGQYMKLPEKYADPKTSGLKMSIKKGSNTKDWDLTD